MLRVYWWNPENFTLLVLLFVLLNLLLLINLSHITYLNLTCDFLEYLVHSGGLPDLFSNNCRVIVIVLKIPVHKVLFRLPMTNVESNIEAVSVDGERPMEIQESPNVIDMETVPDSDSHDMVISESKIAKIPQTLYLPRCEEIFALNVIYERGSVATDKCSFVEISKGRKLGNILTDYVRNEHGWEGLVVASGDSGDATGKWDRTEYENVNQADIPSRIAGLIECRFKKTNRIMIDLLIIDADSPRKVVRMIPWKLFGFAVVCVSHEDPLKMRNKGATGHHSRKYLEERGYSLISSDVLKQVMISETHQDIKTGTPGDKGRVSYFASADWFVNYSFLSGDQRARAGAMVKSFQPAEVCATNMNTDDYISSMMQRLGMSQNQVNKVNKAREKEKPIFKRILKKQISKSSKKSETFARLT